jgi:hypothetical protein
MSSRRLLASLVLLGSLWFVGCGGGGSNSQPPPAPPPPPPPAAPKIAYPSTAYSFSVNVAAQTIPASSTGGAVVSWSAMPSLPAGLTLDATDGSISGTPTVATALATYVVTATNSGGHSSFNLSLAVGPAPILDVGHTNGLALMRFNGSALLSLDGRSPAAPPGASLGHWVLQDYASGSILASGDLAACSNPFNCNDITVLNAYGVHYPTVDLAGNTMVDPIPGGASTTCCAGHAPGGVEIREASTGQVLATIAGQFWWYQLAADGSYLVTASDTSLTAYSRSGQKLFSLPGLYRTATVFSTSTTVEVAFLNCPGNPPMCPGKSGTNVIETIPVASGSPSATAPFQGTFYAWFQDGARFLTTLGSTVYTYSAAGAQVDSAVVAPFRLAGTAPGSWWWTLSNSTGLSVYKVGSGATPAFTLPQAPATIVSSGPTLGAFAGGDDPNNQLTVIDLSGATPVSAAYTTPTGGLGAYAASSAALWVAGDMNGVVIDGASLGGQPRYLTLGAVQSIAAGSSFYSVATASGQIRYFDAGTNTLAGTINFPTSALAASSDGTVIAAKLAFFSYFSGPPPTGSVNIYSLPSAAQINSFPFSFGFAPAISLSASGTVLGQVTCNYSGCIGAANAVTGGATLWSDTTGKLDRARLSPDGTLVATSTQRFSTPSPVTSIYQNGVLGTSAPGWIVGWLDNTTLLVDNYQVSATPPNDTVYLGNIVYSAAGTVISKPSLPETLDYTVITSDAVYSPSKNIIYSLTTSAPAWMSASRSSGIGAASASQVVFTSATLVLAQPH